MRVVSDRVWLELLRFVRVAVRWLAEMQRACLSTLAFISWKQMGRRGKTVPRGMYETYDPRLDDDLTNGMGPGAGLLLSMSFIH
jgi:hypothetical protein